jgi:putative membrane protein
MKRKMVALLLLALLVLPSAALAGGVAKNETVYVSLANNGSVKEIVVANWAHGTPDGDIWIDHGRYDLITNSTTATVPTVDGDRIAWPASALADDGLFYQGSLRQELPVEVAIEYELNGKRTEPDQLAGRSGELVVTIRLHNRLRQSSALKYTGWGGARLTSKQSLCTPLLCQLSLTLSTAGWHGVEADGATKVLVGDKLQLGWGVFPLPDSEIRLRMRSERIELEPLDLVVVPMLPPLPELTGEGELRQMIAGLDALRDGLNTAGTARPAGGAGLSPSQIATAFSQLTEGLARLEQGALAAQQGSQSLASGLGQVRALTTQMSAQCDALLRSGDPLLQALAARIAAQEQALTGLLAGAADLTGGLTATHSGLEAIRSLLAGAGEQLAGLESLGAGLGRVDAALETMRQGAVAQYNQLCLGRAVTAELKRLSEDYRSFAANSENCDSSVQFVLRTEGITVPEPPAAPAPAVVRQSFWSRLVKLITGK